MPPATYEEIVGCSGRPTLVLAGPGAGKTYLLADRFKRLIHANGIDTTTLLTFGRDTKAHLERILVAKFGVHPKTLKHVHTMHSLARQIVFENPRWAGLRKTNLEIQPDDKAQELLYRDSALLRGLSREVGRQALECKHHGDCTEDHHRTECTVCSEYRRIMAVFNRIDFDDLVIFACRILEEHPDILREYQLKARALLVDEYQDINAAQHRMIELLSRESRDGLFVVGDDAQSVYSFRGSSPNFILKFPEDYENAWTPTLAYGRRCPCGIHEAAFRLLEAYCRDWSGRPDLKYTIADEQEPYVWRLTSELAEAKAVARIAKKYGSDGTVLVLAPKREFFPTISAELERRDIPHTFPADFVPESIEILKLFLEWCTDPDDSFKTRLVLERLITGGIAHIPGSRPTSRTTPETITRRIEQETRIAALWQKVNRKRSLLSAILQLTDTSGPLAEAGTWMHNLMDSHSTWKTRHGEFLKDISKASGIWVDPEKMRADLSRVAAFLSPGQPLGTASVQLMTMRKAKGLEADVVIVVGLEDGIMPSPLGSFEEEARLMYVAMTRTKSQLHLMHSVRRPRNISHGEALRGKERSRFLDTLAIKSKWFPRAV
jgi:DNA helicase-2/ATP-dependent DNA helicase PcrA